MMTMAKDGVGLLFIVPAPMNLTRSDVRNILNRSQNRARGRSVYVVILCLDYDENIVDLFEQFDGNVAITATTLSVLSDKERYQKLADRIIPATEGKSGIQLQNLDLDQGGQAFGVA